ncbi:hypothetical protein Tco_1528990 [Tanacetum coccineum]
MIGKLNEQIQSRGNTIHELKEKISRLTEKNIDANHTPGLKALASQNKDLAAKLNALHDLNECYRAENAKVKQHYKELYDSIKIARAKTTKQNNSLLSKIANLKAQLKDNSKYVTIPVSKPLLLGGDPGHVTMQPDFFFNKDLEYLRYGHKIDRPALSISKMKTAYYPDVGLEQMVPDQIWIKEECKYDVAAMYGISHWWFQRQRFYIAHI